MNFVVWKKKILIQIPLKFVPTNLRWGLLSQFPPYCYFLQHHPNICWPFNITFIFDMCRRSSAAVTHVKYECDAKNLTGTFTGPKIFLTEKLRNRALVTSNPDWLYVICLLGNGLATNWQQQANNWINVDSNAWHHMEITRPQLV